LEGGRGKVIKIYNSKHLYKVGKGLLLKTEVLTKWLKEEIKVGEYVLLLSSFQKLKLVYGPRQEIPCFLTKPDLPIPRSYKRQQF